MTMCCWSLSGSGTHIVVVVTPRLLAAAVVPRGVGSIGRTLVKAKGVIFRDRLVGAALPFGEVSHDSLTDNLLLPMSTEVVVERRRVVLPPSLVVATPPLVQAVTAQWEAACNARGPSGRKSARTGG